MCRKCKFLQEEFAEFRAKEKVIGKETKEKDHVAIVLKKELEESKLKTCHSRCSMHLQRNKMKVHRRDYEKSVNEYDFYFRIGKENNELCYYLQISAKAIGRIFVTSAKRFSKRIKK